MPGNKLQYTIDYVIDDPHLLDGITEQRANELALPVMQYAVKRRLFERASVDDKLAGKTLKPSLIGVAITLQDAPAHTRGYRVSRAIDEVALTTQR